MDVTKIGLDRRDGPCVRFEEFRYDAGTTIDVVPRGIWVQSEANGQQGDAMFLSWIQLLSAREWVLEQEADDESYA